MNPDTPSRLVDVHDELSEKDINEIEKLRVAMNTAIASASLSSDLAEQAATQTVLNCAAAMARGLESLGDRRTFLINACIAWEPERATDTEWLNLLERHLSAFERETKPVHPDDNDNANDKD